MILDVPSEMPFDDDRDELAIASCCRSIFLAKTQRGALNLRFRYFADANIR